MNAFYISCGRVMLHSGTNSTVKVYCGRILSVSVVPMWCCILVAIPLLRFIVDEFFLYQLCPCDAAFWYQFQWGHVIYVLNGLGIPGVHSPMLR